MLSKMHQYLQRAVFLTTFKSADKKIIRDLVKALQLVIGSPTMDVNTKCKQGQRSI